MSDRPIIGTRTPAPSRRRSSDTPIPNDDGGLDLPSWTPPGVQRVAERINDMSVRVLGHNSSMIHAIGWGCVYFALGYLVLVGFCGVGRREPGSELRYVQECPVPPTVRCPAGGVAMPETVP